MNTLKYDQALAEAPLPAADELQRASADEKMLAHHFDEMRKHLEFTLGRIEGLRRSLAACEALEAALRRAVERDDDAPEEEPRFNPLQRPRQQPDEGTRW